MCLPDHLWTSEVESSGKTVSLIEDCQPSHEHWVRLRKYSHRIRAFDYCMLSPPPVSASTLDIVFLRSLSQELFPSLHTLTVRVLTSSLPSNPIWILYCLCLPRLVWLNLDMPLSHRCMYLVLHFVPTSMPSLQALAIDAAASFNKQWQVTHTPLVVSFRDIPYLRSLHLSRNLDPVSSITVHELIHLQYLRDLNVALPYDFDVDRHLSMQPILPSLQSLAINAGSLKQCSRLLSSITSSELSSVKVSSCSLTQSDIYALFQEIECIHECCPDFHMLNVGCPYYLIRPITDPSFDLLQSTLTPLFTCYHLHVLKIRSFYKLDIDDTFITQITLAWPYIKFLDLHGDLPQVETHVTLQGMHELLQGCSQLSTLKMCVDARILPKEEPKIQSSSLKRLNILGSCVADKMAVEHYLRVLTPNLKLLSL
ncbi:hypothetical protein EDC04DRAFT_2637226 [Pisolithus marmoratus]|nr:hypothetical protein EDC04DRAFT_2637226 [Pisolithus marmoratus]